MYERSHAGATHASGGRLSTQQDEPRPLRFRRELESAKHEVDAIAEVLGELTALAEQGDSQGWLGARSRLSLRLALGKGALARAQVFAKDASESERAQLQQTMALLAMHEVTVSVLRRPSAAPTATVAPMLPMTGLTPYAPPVMQVPVSEPFSMQAAATDSALDRAFDDTSGDHVDLPLAKAIASLDAAERRALARRFQTYRPGTGDALAAKFSRLERGRREQILHVLDATTMSVELTAAAEDKRVSMTNPALLMFHDRAPKYFANHREAFATAIHERLSAAKLAAGAPQLVWRDYAKFVDELARASYLPNVEQLPQITHPIDPWAVIDQHRTLDPIMDANNVTGAMTWVPAAGVAIASAFERAVHAALPRVAHRYAAQASEPGVGANLSADRILPSAPIDRLVALAMCARDVVGVSGSPIVATRDAAPRRIEHVEWLGCTDPTLWNWMRVIPADATAEEIALSQWGDSGYAQRLTLTHGLVAVPADLARAFPDAAKYEPHHDRIEVPGTQRTPQSPEAQLAASALANEMALEQAPPADVTIVTADRAEIAEDVESTRAILDETARSLAPWDLAREVSPALAFANGKAMWVELATAEDLRRWAPVLSRQRELARESAIAVLETLARASEMSLPPTESNVRVHPIGVALRGFAEAAGTSHLASSSAAILQRARKAYAEIGIRIIEDANRESMVTLTNLPGGETREELEASQLALSHDLAQIRSDATKGAADADAVDRAVIEIERLQFRTQLAQLRRQLDQAASTIASLDEGRLAKVANAFAGSHMILLGVRLGSAISQIAQIEELIAKDSREAIEAKFAGIAADADGGARQFELVQGRRARLDIQRHAFADVVKRFGLQKEVFDEVAEMVRDAQLRGLFLNIGIMVALTIATNGVAAFAGEFVGGLYTGSRVVTTTVEAANLVKTARTIAGVTEVFVDAGLSAGANTKLFGDDLKSGFVENLLTSAGVLAALKPLKAVASKWGLIDEQLLALWERNGNRWKLAATRTVIVTGEMVVSAATAYVVHRLSMEARGETPDEQTLAMWAAQGATMALGKYIASHLEDAMTRLAKLGSYAGDLTGRAAAQLGLAMRVQAAPDSDAGLELIAAHNELLAKELEVWRSLEQDPSRAEALGLEAGDIRQHLEGAESQLADTRGKALAQLPLRLAGLEQEIPGGRLWVGDTEQIAIALHQAERAGSSITIEQWGGDARTWIIKLNDETLIIRERARVGRVREAIGKNQVADADVAHARRYADAARALRAKAEARIKGIVEATPDFATDVLHLGDAFAGIMNRNTRYDDGLHTDPHAHLVVSTHDGVMTGRGDLPSGQNADLQTMPGIRTREHTTDHEAFNTSDNLRDATDVGRLEMQSPTYRAWAYKIEDRSSVPADQWAHPEHSKRVRMKSLDGKEVVIYAKQIDIATGMGPALFEPIKAVLDVAGTTFKDREEMFDAMRSAGVLLAADDPQLSSKLHAGERVFVIGGSPSGAWAAEDASRHGAEVTLAGGLVGPDQVKEFFARLNTATTDAERQKLIDEEIAKKHSGSKLRRNQQPGAAYGPDAKERGMNVHMGAAEEIELLPNGKVRVRAKLSSAADSNPDAELYDRVVVAIGQNPSAPGGVGSMLGPVVRNAEVPDGTIALKPMKQGEKLVGLESEDGTIRVLGASYAMQQMSSWVKAEHRREFSDDVARMAAEGEATHTGEPITKDSAGVTTGIEAQRDRLPLANELLALREFELPRTISPEILSLPADDTKTWSSRLVTYLTTVLRARPGRVNVKEMRRVNGVPTFEVQLGGSPLGTIHVYDGSSARRGTSVSGGVSIELVKQ